MKIKQAINLHKGATAPLVLGLMFAYDNFTIAPWIYLSLHGTYGVMWLIKDALYPDKQWEEETSVGQGAFIFRRSSRGLRQKRRRNGTRTCSRN